MSAPVRTWSSTSSLLFPISLLAGSPLNCWSGWPERHRYTPRIPPQFRNHGHHCDEDTSELKAHLILVALPVPTFALQACNQCQVRGTAQSLFYRKGPRPPGFHPECNPSKPRERSERRGDQGMAGNTTQTRDRTQGKGTLAPRIFPFFNPPNVTNFIFALYSCLSN